MLQNKRDLNPRIGRWFIKLSEYNYEIEYHTGVINTVADALSRYSVEEGMDTEIEGLPVFHISDTTDWVAAMQRADAEIMSISKKLEDGDSEAHKRFTMCSGRIYKVSKGNFRLYVPSDLRHDIVGEAHRNLNHFGIDKTLDKIKECYYFQNLRDFVTKYVNRCISCLYHKTPNSKGTGYSHPLEKGNVCFHTVHMDHLGPFVKTDAHNKYV